MRLQISLEIMMNMVIALSIALFLSVLISTASITFARNERAIANILNHTNYNFERLLETCSVCSVNGG